MLKRDLLRTAIVCLLWLPGLAEAHAVSGSGFTSGLLHPILGLDHLLAMVSVGILSAQLGGRAIWLVPAAFVSCMILGGVLGILGIYWPFVELGITMSVILLGIALAAHGHIPVAVGLGLAGFFGIFHGHAHGTEMPEVAEPVWFTLGFVTGTVAMHLTGVAIGLAAEPLPSGDQWLRYLGAGVAGIGVHILYELLMPMEML
ncbi:urease accessory protein [Methylomarinovum caldicuralii]|uniref:Urease accessory protein n=1 Tax=Methylomarinovum caldicuralii TaxID=438856 RepID=A0AAU9CDH7_9GAMM|nr:HupE/UreJ family protein [Methylomarinovum caldicuralii]BCX82684.1 urease accessory protein [Methylomarinovum caldicuralii]